MSKVSLKKSSATAMKPCKYYTKDPNQDTLAQPFITKLVRGLIQSLLCRYNQDILRMESLILKAGSLTLLIWLDQKGLSRVLEKD